MCDLLVELVSDGILLLTTCLLCLSLLNLLHYSGLIGLLGNHAVSFFECLNKNIDSGVKFVKIVLHVFLLTSLAFRLFIRVELIEVFFVAVVLAAELIHGQLVLIAGFLAFFFQPILIILLGAGVLLLHKSLSSFQSTSLDVFSSLWEEITELIKHILLNTHEDDIR